MGILGNDASAKEVLLAIEEVLESWAIELAPVDHDEQDDDEEEGDEAHPVKTTWFTRINRLLELSSLGMP